MKEVERPASVLVAGLDYGFDGVTDAADLPQMWHRDTSPSATQLSSPRTRLAQQHALAPAALRLSFKSPTRTNGFGVCSHFEAQLAALTANAVLREVPPRMQGR